MFIKKIKFNQFDFGSIRAFGEKEIHFKHPDLDDTEVVYPHHLDSKKANPDNIINVITGKDGTYKSKLLKFIHKQQSNEVFIEYTEETFNREFCEILLFNEDSLCKDYSPDKIKELIIRDLTIHRNSSKEANSELREQEALIDFNKRFGKIRSKLTSISVCNKALRWRYRHDFKDLDKGEQRYYSILVPAGEHSAVILIDEPELHMHPELQKEFMRTLRTIGSSNQFIITTNSPFIIQELHPTKDRIILLDLDNHGAIQIEHDAKFIEKDINTIASVMGCSDALPAEVLRLRKKYREYFENKEEETNAAKEIKHELLKYEPLESDFFQELEFLKKLQNAK